VNSKPDVERRPRPLTPQVERRLEALRSWKRWLDEAFRVPGTGLRVGWDPIIGLLPWAGDVLTALFACGVIVQAHQMRLPRVVQLRMLLNVVIDLTVGAIPFLGDVADVFWKSNSRNFALLETHAYEVRPPSRAARSSCCTGSVPCCSAGFEASPLNCAPLASLVSSVSVGSGSLVSLVNQRWTPL
jgi:hypothetical protein